MGKSPHNFFQAIAAASDEKALRLLFMKEAGEYFGAECWGLCLLNEQSQAAEVDIQGGPNVDAFVQRYEKIGRSTDPVLRYVFEHHAPTHEGVVFAGNDWKESELYQNCYAYYDQEHVMMGPIVNHGRLIGGAYFTRASDAPAFNLQDLASLSGLCLHLSARLAVFRPQAFPRLQPSISDRLTEREQQIAELVAQGLTNAEIGEKLWITQNTVKQALKRMFRKLNVSTRTEMVARLGDSLNP
ncbi:MULTISPECIES: LuxR C-terminal-related transcriptional regulator [Trichocoleus]|uniref:LuxR C-terminal-related transcriptional regulator n=1 Tax=Trichocoleus desertorum GB2-A4 TaxID=2933944 RepID=A0ABV0J9X0_9CYAN|nr:LuxR C-terminal-related transcriptional regulator [Trichocoleus sp. FACHB-46]MBD1862917.1 LuxR family transcriptional regulator [Trichocoleus sp. FACHB-46]